MPPYCCSTTSSCPEGWSIIAGGGGDVGGRIACAYPVVVACWAVTLANRCRSWCCCAIGTNPIRPFINCIAPGGARTPLPKNNPVRASAAWSIAIFWDAETCIRFATLLVVSRNLAGESWAGLGAMILGDVCTSFVVTCWVAVADSFCAS